MKMKYEEMMDVQNKKKYAEDYNASGDKFSMTASQFNVFTTKSWGEPEKEKANANWKAHISIDPTDLARAWDLIFPLLHSSADQFKIVDANRLKKAEIENAKVLQVQREQHQNFVENYVGNKLTLVQLETLAKTLSQEPAQYRDILGNPAKLFEYVESKYAAQVGLALQSVEEVRRMSEGMQITIYMPPGSEREYQQLMENIEQVLVTNNIKPGAIYKTDRPLGTYTSIRHPGNEYHDAVVVESYNPDNASDNFDDLVTKKLAEFMVDIRYSAKLLTSSKIEPSMGDTEKNNVQIRNELGKKLESLINDFEALGTTAKREGLNQFKNNCIHEIKEADKQLKNDKEWQPLLKNLALLFSGVGTLVAIVSIAERVLTGRYGVFDNKELLFTQNESNSSESLTPEAETIAKTQSIKDRLQQTIEGDPVTKEIDNENPFSMG